MKINKGILLLLSVLSGVILALAWPEKGFPGLLFIGLVPMLLVEDQIATGKDRFARFAMFFYAWPGFLTWNLLTTWWIVNSTAIGAILAIVLNSLFMSVVFQVFHYTKKQYRNSLSGYLSLLIYWIAFEYLHLNWNLNWPWLNLGNGFASYYKWVQWYEYTGALGGTFWVLLANILGYQLLNAALAKFRPVRFMFLAGGIWLLWILFPIGISLIIYDRYQEKIDPVRVVVVQPDLDPYSEQYNLPPVQVVGRIMKLANPLLDSTTQFLIAPESAIQEQMWENDLSTFSSIRLLREEVLRHPRLNILVGGSTFHYFREGEPVSLTARKFRDADRYYDAYNTAILVNAIDTLQLYHKSKLTPGVEILPTFRGIKFLEKYAIDLGGTVGSLGTDTVRRVYRTIGTPPAAAVICYESVFGGFFAEFVRNGARVMFIITNDGWWGDTPGYRQHFAFAHLRAIETRRSIARSANTGISAFIDQRGDAHQATAYWVPAAIKGTLNANPVMTFYVTYGDYLGRAAAWLVVFSLGGAIFLRIRNKIKGYGKTR